MGMARVKGNGKIVKISDWRGVGQEEADDWSRKDKVIKGKWAFLVITGHPTRLPVVLQIGTTMMSSKAIKLTIIK